MASNKMTTTTTTTNITGATRGSKTSADSITFKVYSNEHAETRLFLMPRQCTTYQAVAARIVELFGFNGCIESPRQQQLQVQYTDDENDLVTITTDEELRTALQLFSGKPSLRLIVSVKKNAGNTIQASECNKAFEVPAIEPDHAESVVPRSPVICSEAVAAINHCDNECVAVSEPVSLEEASEKLATLVDSTAPVVVGVATSEVPTTISSGLTVVPATVDGAVAKPTVVSVVDQEPKRILSKEERIKLREARLAAKAKRDSMASKLVQLEELGFGAQRGHCLRLLLKYDGDVDQVVKEMKAWAQAKEAREKLKSERDEKRKLKEEYKMKKAQVHAQKKELIEEKRKSREMMLERKKLKDELKQERCLKKAEMIEKKKLMKENFVKEKKLIKLEKLEKKMLAKKDPSAADDKPVEHPEFEDFKSQLVQLEAMGFKCKHRNVRLLRKFEGDVNKVVNAISFKEAERLHAYADKHGLIEYEAANQAAFVKLAELGHDNKKLNVRLLKQCKGDVDKVILHLRIIEERKRHRAEMARLLATAGAGIEAQAHPVSVN